MKSRAFFCFLAVVLVGVVAIPAFGQNQFVKTLGGPVNDCGYSVVETSDSGLVVTGATASFSEGSYDFLLTKFDASGGWLWTRTLGGTTNNDEGHSVVEVSDGGLVVTGYTESYGAGYRDLLLAKFGSAGNHLWTKTLEGTGYDWGFSVVEVSDGGLVVTGHTESYGAGNGDLLLTKFDASGGWLWTRTLGGTTDYDYGYCVVEVSDGGLVVTGYTDSYGAGNGDLLLAKFDNSGNHLWTKTLAGTDDDWGYCVVEVSDGGLVVTGGTISYGAGYHDLLLTKFDDSGNHLWTRTMGGTDDDWGGCVVEVSDGGLVVTGGTISYGAGGFDVLLTKFDADGNTCMGKFVTPEIHTIYPSVAAVEPTVTPANPDTATWDPTITSPTPTITMMCEGLGFRPNPNGWCFSNDTLNMWPHSWWRRFDYTQYPYPYTWRFFCSSSDFPDWPLFVSVFGEAQCYYDSPPGRVIYKPSAVARWFAIKKAWNGSCFGFAISSLLFFDGYLDVDSVFPGDTLLYSVPINDGSRLMVNKYQFYQNGKAQKQYFDDNYNSTTPNQTLDSCKAMFNSSTRNDRILSLSNNHGSGSHAVVPYRCEVDPQNPDTTYIYVYDSNWPHNEFQVSIYTNTNTWYYNGKPKWGGGKHLFLMDPVSNYTTNPILPTSIPPRDRGLNEKTGATSQFVEFYNSSANTVLFNSPAGSIGHMGDSLFTTLSQGHPIIPITGQETLPIGYYLRNDVWTCQFSGFTDSVFSLSLFTDRTVLVYSRTDADSTQCEKLRYPGNDSTIWVGNPDLSTRPYDLEVICVAPDSEIVCGIHNISIDQNDSACYSITPLSGLQVDNYGGEKTYDLRVEIANANVDTVFFHSDITLSGITSHQIIPNWRQNGDSLIILVDEGMDGTFEDTMRVANEGTHVATREPEILTIEFSLSQNYPNPFNTTTQIKYTLPRDCRVKLEVYNILGQKVASLVDRKQKAGHKTIRWDAGSLSSGIYFYRLQAGGYTKARKMILLR